MSNDGSHVQNVPLKGKSLSTFQVTPCGPNSKEEVKMHFLLLLFCPSLETTLRQPLIPFILHFLLLPLTRELAPHIRIDHSTAIFFCFSPTSHRISVVKILVVSPSGLLNIWCPPYLLVIVYRAGGQRFSLSSEWVSFKGLIVLQQRYAKPRS